MLPYVMGHMAKKELGCFLSRKFQIPCDPSTPFRETKNQTVFTAFSLYCFPKAEYHVLTHNAIYIYFFFIFGIRLGGLVTRG